MVGTEPYVALWRAVIVRAIRDATLDDSYYIEMRDFLAARHFLLRDNEWFPVAADFAGFDPQDLRARIRRLI